MIDAGRALLWVIVTHSSRTMCNLEPDNSLYLLLTCIDWVCSGTSYVLQTAAKHGVSPMPASFLNYCRFGSFLTLGRFPEAGVVIASAYTLRVNCGDCTYAVFVLLYRGVQAKRSGTARCPGWLLGALQM